MTPVTFAGLVGTRRDGFRSPPLERRALNLKKEDPDGFSFTVGRNPAEILFSARRQFFYEAQIYSPLADLYDFGADHVSFFDDVFHLFDALFG